MSDSASAAPRRGVSHPTIGDSAATVIDREEQAPERQTVSDLVRNYGDSLNEAQKRDRSESGDSAPAGKRGARELSSERGRSPLALSSRSFKENLDAAMEGLESRLMVALSREIHDFRETITAEIVKLNERVKDLEQHVEERDGAISHLTEELRQSREEVLALQTRVEDAEINSRLPCLILSGAAMAPRHAPRLEPPLPIGHPASGRRPPGAPAALAGPGRDRTAVTSQPADRAWSGPAGQSTPEAGGGRVRSDARAGDWEEREDVHALVVNTLNRCMPGLDLRECDIDRAHRLPGPNNRVIVRFVRSGQGSARDQVMSRRLELRGKDLFVNESLTKLRGLIFRSLLAAKREKKVYTVYSRGGHVFFKEQQHGVAKRVDSLKRVRELGYTVLER